MGQEGTTVENHSVETVSSPSSDVVESLLEAARYYDIDDIMSLAGSVSLDSKNSQGRTDLAEALLTKGRSLCTFDSYYTWLLLMVILTLWSILSVEECHGKSPLDEAVSGQKMNVIDAINESVAQVELIGIKVSSEKGVWVA